MKKEKLLLHWYRLKGVSYADASHTVIDTAFIYIVQAASKRNALKYYGGRRTCLNKDNVKVYAYFSTQEKDVETLPDDWQPNFESEDALRSSGLIVRVFPVTIYTCTYCGRVRYSEYPYPYMWCNCSHKVYPDRGRVVHDPEIAVQPELSPELLPPVEPHNAPVVETNLSANLSSNLSANLPHLNLETRGPQELSTDDVHRSSQLPD
ncbi:hypothetical protein LLE49_27465 [Alicyclobacillus tolerans]|uniref:hypothetical protein n=1 Tax=Alicyclobacillus tolerans TaxID=90970 RepID=UPI001F3E8D6B|nr:hypothetical protein [Alicyclobacillus tolerans]MCF8568461.1 hypothetical protein [Alicyclobacillus tolerans]